MEQTEQTEQMVLEMKAASLDLSDDEFFMLCRENDFLRFERTADKQIIIMTPSGIETGRRNSSILAKLYNWNILSGSGYVFGADTGYTLPNNAVRSPDASWISKSKYDELPQNEKDAFGHICPEFVVEVMSPSDSFKYHIDKMQEWIDNGCKLAWLIYPKQQKAFVYKLGREIIEINGFDNQLSGEDILPGFELELNNLI